MRIVQISFSSKHRNGRAKWSVVDSFPDGRVVQAYMQPDANRNTEPFSWQQPMRHKIGDFCKKVLDWSDNMVSYADILLYWLNGC